MGGRGKGIGTNKPYIPFLRAGFATRGASEPGKLSAEPEFNEKRGDYLQLGISGGPGLLMRTICPTHIFPPNSSTLRRASAEDVAAVQSKGSTSNSGCFAWVNEKCDHDLQAFATCLVYLVGLFGEGRRAESLFSPESVTQSHLASATCPPPIQCFRYSKV